MCKWEFMKKYITGLFTKWTKDVILEYSLFLLLEYLLRYKKKREKKESAVICFI
jgi:hypothetical protein